MIVACKHAYIWWERPKLQGEKEGRNRVRTWERMTQELHKKSLHEGCLQEFYLYLQQFTQGAQFIAEYMKKSLIISCFVVAKPSPSCCYLERLKHDIHDMVQLQPYITINDCIKVEHQLSLRENKFSNIYSSRSKFQS